METARLVERGGLFWSRYGATRLLLIRMRVRLTILSALEVLAFAGTLIYFLGRIFGFEPADQVPPISIDNLSR